MMILLLSFFLISNALTMRKDKSILFSRNVMATLISLPLNLRKNIKSIFSSIVFVVKILAKHPPSPGKNMQAVHSTANLKLVLVVGAFSFIYSDNHSNFDYLYNVFSNISNILPNLYSFKASFIHINHISFFEVRFFKPVVSTSELTPFYSGLDILSNIGNRNFNCYSRTLHLPIYLLMPLIGYIAYNISNIDFSNLLLNIFKIFNRFSSKNFLLNKFNLLKNTLPSIRNITVFMFSGTASGQPGNGGNKDEDFFNKKNKIDKDKLINETKKKRYQLLHEMYNLVSDLEGLVYTLRDLLDQSGIIVTINEDASSTILPPDSLPDADLEVAMTRIDNLDISIRTREESIQSLIGQIDDLETILANNNIIFGQTAINLRNRTLAAMAIFFSLIDEEV